MGLTHDITDLKGFPILNQYEVLDIDQSNHVILIIAVNGNSGIHAFLKQLHYLIIMGIFTDRCHINSWNHNILGNCITEVKHIVDHFPLFRFNDSILMTDLHVGTQFIFRHGCFLICINM